MLLIWKIENHWCRKQFPFMYEKQYNSLLIENGMQKHTIYHAKTAISATVQIFLRYSDDLHIKFFWKKKKHQEEDKITTFIIITIRYLCILHVYFLVLFVVIPILYWVAFYFFLKDIFVMWWHANNYQKRLIFNTEQ